MTKASDILDQYAIHTISGEITQGEALTQLYTELKSVMPEKETILVGGKDYPTSPERYEALIEVDKALAQFFGVELTKGQE